jgi:hypothetical protein
MWFSGCAKSIYEAFQDWIVMARNERRLEHDMP